MKKILVTGASGFIGSHLVEYLVQKNYDVIAFDRYNINNDWGNLERSKYINDFEMILGDIRDYDSVYNVVKKSDTIFHLAALIGIPYSYISPIAYVKTNVEGTYNILESSKNLNIQNTIITSTSEIYGSAVSYPISEKHSIIGQSPYAASKISADQLALSYNLSFNLPIKIIRPFNCYGPRQSARAIIPTIISQLLSNNKNVRLGNLNTIRDLTYVTDLCDAYLKIYKSKKTTGHIVNAGTNKAYSVKDLFYKLSNQLNISKKITIDKQRVRPQKSEITKLICDNRKIISMTNWKPKIDLDKGLKITIDWFKENKDFIKSKSYNV